jgi:chromate reductase
VGHALNVGIIPHRVEPCEHGRVIGAELADLFDRGRDKFDLSAGSLSDDAGRLRHGPGVAGISFPSSIPVFSGGERKFSIAQMISPCVTHFGISPRAHAISKWVNRVAGEFRRRVEQKPYGPAVPSDGIVRTRQGAHARKGAGDMEERISILGFAGSLRKDSVTKALLRLAVELTPTEAEIETFDLAGIPPFNQDEEYDPPEKVREFKARIREADALLIVTP